MEGGDWDQGDGADWYMDDGFSGSGHEGQPTDSLEVYASSTHPTDSLEVYGPSSQPTDSLEVYGSRAVPSSVEHHFNQHPPLSISLSLKDQNKIMRSIVEIFELEETPPNEDVEMEGDGDEEPVVDLEDQRRRTERLRGTLPALAQLWWSDSVQMDVVAEKLGDGSRDRKPNLFQTTVHHSSL
jgi:hypothetical protein